MFPILYNHHLPDIEVTVIQNVIFKKSRLRQLRFRHIFDGHDDEMSVTDIRGILSYASQAYLFF